MGWLLLPAAARPHAAAAESVLRAGGGREEIWPHLEKTMENTADDAAGAEAALDFYKRMLRISKYRDGSSELLAPTLLSHLRAQSGRQRPLQADSAVAHLAAAEAIFRGDTCSALSLLADLRAEEVPLSAGSFDLVIQHAGRTRDRRAAYASYRQLRRARLQPSAFTLNALMTAETRCGEPQNALKLLSRALDGSPRWPGAPPDAWSYATAMTAASASKRYLKVNQLFQKLMTEPQLRERATTTAYNLAVEARVRLKDRPGALRILKRMQSGSAGAPPPQARTFNMMLAACADRGERYAWVLTEMAASGVQPDSYTVCAMLKQQQNLRDARGVWRWGRKRDAALGVRAWHHLIEAHIRHGQPWRCAALLQLMESRDGLKAHCTRSHNLYLRALLADGRPDEAIAHFERMCEAAEATRLAQPQPSRLGYDGKNDYGFAQPEQPHETDTTESGVGKEEDGPNAASRPQWLRRQPPPADEYSYAIALTALRRQEGGGNLLKKGTKSIKAQRLMQEAENRGLWQVGNGKQSIPAPVAHALVCACGDDVPAAIAFWRDHLRPRLLAMRDERTPNFNPPGAQPTAEQAAYHALLRVCGAAERADEALRIVYAMKRDGFPADASCYSAYMRGKETSTKRGVARLLQGGYERVLALELAPERAGPPSPLGKIEKIRIQF